jgi:hypothetical protein
MRIHDLPPPFTSNWRTLEPYARAPSPSARAVKLQAAFKQQFRALSADKQRFHEVMRGSFGAGYDARRAERYRLQALAEDFGWLPQVSWVDPVILEGARGAYYAEFGTVFLDRALQLAPELAAATFAEEAGHVLEALLAPVGSPEDGGERFRRVLWGEGLA